jgi:hypothetical protein
VVAEVVVLFGAGRSTHHQVTVRVQIGGSLRGRAKTQVALRDGFPVSLRPPLAEFTAAD